MMSRLISTVAVLPTNVTIHMPEGPVYENRDQNISCIVDRAMPNLTDIFWMVDGDLSVGYSVETSSSSYGKCDCLNSQPVVFIVAKVIIIGIACCYLYSIYRTLTHTT